MPYANDTTEERLQRLAMVRESSGELIKYAWPGGHPVVYFDGDGESICPDCAPEFDPSMGDLPDPDHLAGYFIHYQGPPELCAECGAEIPSAYGNPNEGE